MAGFSLRFLAALLPAVLLLTVPGSARSQRKSARSEAHGLHRRALKQARAGRMGDAAAAWAEAERLYPSSKYALNLCMAYAALSEPFDAWDACERARTRGVAPELEEQLEKASAQIARELFKDHALLVLAVQPPGATVTLDGQAWLPSGRGWLPRSHSMAVVAHPRFQTRTMRLEHPIGTRSSHEIALVPAGEARRPARELQYMRRPYEATASDPARPRAPTEAGLPPTREVRVPGATTGRGSAIGVVSPESVPALPKGGAAGVVGPETVHGLPDGGASAPVPSETVHGRPGETTGSRPTTIGTRTPAAGQGGAPGSKAGARRRPATGAAVGSAADPFTGRVPAGAKPDPAVVAERPGGRSALAVAMGVSTLVIGLAGGGLAGWYALQADEVNVELSGLKGSALGPYNTYDDYRRYAESRVQDRDDARTRMWVFGAIGGASLLTSIVVFAASGPDSLPPTALVPMPTDGGAGVRWSGSF